MKHRIVALMLIALLAVGSAACGKETADEEEVNTVLVSVAHPTKDSISVASEFVGTVAPEDEVSVYPLVSGTITKKNFEVGDSVQAGAVLFTIDDTDAKFAAEKAAAAYDAAQANVAASEANLAATAAGNELTDIQNNQLADLTTESQLKTLNDQLRTAQDSADTYNKQKKDLNDQYSTAMNSLSNLNKQLAAEQARTAGLKDALTAKTNEYNTAVTAADSAAKALAGAAAADHDAKKAEADAAVITVTAKKAEMDTAQDNLDENTAVIASIQSQIGTLSATYKNLDSTIASARLAEENADTNVASIKENIRLTQETAALKKAQINTKTDEVNADKLAATQATLNAASANAQAAASTAAQAQNALSHYSVTAPISGTIESISIDENQMAQAGSPAYVISNKDNMVVTFKVTEDVSKAFTLGDKVTASRSGEDFSGVITEIGGMADSQTKLFPIKASLGSVDGLASGISMKVSAYTKHATDVVTVPYDTLYFQGGSSYVFVAEGNKAVRRPVVTGLMDDTKAEIIDGLGMDDDVIVTWSSQLKDGCDITIDDKDAKKNDTQKSEGDGASESTDKTKKSDDAKDSEGTDETKKSDDAKDSEDADDTEKTDGSGTTEQKNNNTSNDKKNTDTTDSTDATDKDSDTDAAVTIREEDKNDDGSVGMVSTKSFIATLSGGCIADTIAESEAHK